MDNFTINMPLIKTMDVAREINYDDIVKKICDNVDERIKFVAVAIPISYFIGNWFYNKATKKGWFDNENKIIPFFDINIQRNIKKPIKVEATFMTLRELILDMVVPMCRMFQMFAMGMLIYYIFISGIH